MIVAGRYELGELLGAGGEARVYRAHDRGGSCDVALRLSPAPRENSTRQIAPPPHSGWVQLLDCGIDPEHGSFVVFELLQGETLAASVARGPLHPAALEIFNRQALDAVGALHAAGWVHGDLNAANFFFHANATWKLLELPFHRDPPPANRSPLFGSIYTLAPEQIEGCAPDARSDLFALGCLFYYAASGRYPHGEGNEADIAIGRLRFAPEPLAPLAPNLPTHVSTAIMRLLAREPAERPASAEAACQLLGS